MSFAVTLPPPSPASSFLSSASHLRLSDQDLTMLSPFSCGLSASSAPLFPPPYLSLSPASLHMPAFADLVSSSPLSRSSFTDHLHCKTKPHSPLQSPFNRASSVLRAHSSLGSDAHLHVKDSRGNGSDSLPKNGSTSKGPRERKRPARLAIPESAKLASLEKAQQFVLPEQEFSAWDTHSYEAALFAVSSKRGRKDCMEDAHTASTHFEGNPNQAFFGVFDGHGGKQAADFAAEHLGRHISMAIQNQKEGNACLEDAMRMGYMTADTEFLNEHVRSGAAVVSALVRDGEMVIANAGDCKAVLCRAGKAEALSAIHRASNEAERQRVTDLGGYVDCFNGVWRVQGTLAITRGLGDANLKQWVSAEPAAKKISITPDCEFLILASDGLWDQMSDQEAVDCARKVLVEADVISKDKEGMDYTSAMKCKDRTSYYPTSHSAAQNKEDNLQDSTCKTDACNELIRIACRKGNRDDVTVMIVLLQSFAIA